MNIDGYRSASMIEGVAVSFAAKAEDDNNDKVLLRIKMENKKGKYYICLDRADYTIYLDE